MSMCYIAFMQEVTITRYAHNQHHELLDTIADEDVLNVDVVYGPPHNRNTFRLSSTMRTPGHDEELVLGLLFSLGIINHLDDVHDVTSCKRGRLDPMAQQTITITLNPRLSFSPLNFSFGMPRYSSCGICGIASVDAQTRTLTHKDISIEADLLSTLLEKMAAAQTAFKQTGGTHAAALFDYQGQLISCHEDVGRHNALDKLIGAMLKSHALPLHRSILLMSSRASFEIVQKAATAHIPIVAVVSAVSSLAVKYADESNITLVGFLRGERFNVYAQPQRITQSNGLSLPAL